LFTVTLRHDGRTQFAKIDQVRNGPRVTEAQRGADRVSLPSERCVAAGKNLKSTRKTSVATPAALKANEKDTVSARKPMRGGTPPAPKSVARIKTIDTARLRTETGKTEDRREKPAG
jgi:hypothetical protein